MHENSLTDNSPPCNAPLLLMMEKAPGGPEASL